MPLPELHKLGQVAKHFRISKTRLRELAKAAGVALPAPGRGKRDPWLSDLQIQQIANERDRQMSAPERELDDYVARAVRNTQERAAYQAAREAEKAAKKKEENA